MNRITNIDEMLSLNLFFNRKKAKPTKKNKEEKQKPFDNIKIPTPNENSKSNKDPKKEGCLDEELIEDDNSVALSYVLKIGQIYTAKEILKKFDESIRLNSLKP